MVCGLPKRYRAFSNALFTSQCSQIRAPIQPSLAHYSHVRPGKRIISVTRETAQATAPGYKASQRGPAAVGANRNIAATRIIPSTAARPGDSYGLTASAGPSLLFIQRFRPPTDANEAARMDRHFHNVPEPNRRTRKPPEIWKLHAVLHLTAPKRSSSRLLEQHAEVIIPAGVDGERPCTNYDMLQVRSFF